MSLSTLVGRLSLIRRTATTVPPRSTTTTILPQNVFRRTMGGYPGGTPQSMKARLFEGHSQEYEGWEMDAAVTTALTVLMCVVAYFKPDVTIGAWAEEEARARLELKAQGFDKFEFGTHYHTVKVVNREADWDTFLSKAIKPGEDDDDDEEEGEDEDEEDDSEEEE